MKNLILLSLLFASTYAMAQDDDLYFVPEKPQKQKALVDDDAVPSDRSIHVYNNSSRDEDEYNRMYSYSGKAQNAGSADHDSLYSEYETVEDAEDYSNEEDDFMYSRRILRFRSPRLGYALSSPLYWDLVYSYGAYDYLYDSYYYDPFFWGYGWRYGWSWGPWDCWYGPIWGWTPVHHWHYWGCGPMWGGIHSPIVGMPNRHQNRGTFDNRIGRGERIRTSAIAASGRGSSNRTSALSGRSSAWGRSSLSADPQTGNQRVGTSRGRTNSTESSYSRYQRSRSKESSTYRGNTTERQRTSGYTRPSSSRQSSERNNSSSTRVNSSRSNSNTRSSQSYRNSTSSSTSSRSSFTSGGGSSRSSAGSSFGGGSRNSGGSSRGGRR